MASEQVVTTIFDDDGTTVIDTFTTTRTIDPRTANSHRINDKIDNGVAVIEQHIVDVIAEIAAMPAYNQTQVRDSLVNEVLPALRDALRGIAWIGRHVRGILDNAGPS